MRRLLLLFALSTALVQAQPTAAESPDSQASILPVRVSPEGAVALSLAGTVVGVLLPFGNLVPSRYDLWLVAVGTSAGNIVLGNGRDALIGTGIRAGGLVLLTMAFSADSAGELAALGGAALYLAGFSYDVYTSAQYAARVTVTTAADGVGAAVRIWF